MFKHILLLSSLFALSLSYEGFTQREITFENNLKEEEVRKLHNDHLEARGRLSGGSVAGDTEFPFAADVITVWPDNSLQGCSGAIIATFIIITSRDCMISNDNQITPTNVFVQVGAANRDVSRMGSFVIRAKWLDRWGMPQGPHPNFAIADLSDNLQMGATVNVIRLPSFPQSTSNFAGSNVNVVGWGPRTGRFLHWSALVVSSTAERETVAQITEYELACRPGTAGFEPGDNGGPVFIREGTANTLIGTIWTQRSGMGGNSITFMQIGQFWDFIHDVTGIPRRWT